MAVIFKLGSRGDEVKDIQRILSRAGYSVAADGVFGPKTQAAVKAFQQSKHITPDGIVGPVTHALLLATAVTSAATAKNTDKELAITKNFIYTHITRCSNRKIAYIAIHYTAGSSSKNGSVLITRSVFLNRPASADFAVDDGQIMQINPDIRNYYCWAVGDKKKANGGGRLYGVASNKNTISIEICSNLEVGTTAAVPNHRGWFFTDRALENAQKLVRHLMKTYDIPKENVVRHYDITGKLCPGLVGWNDGKLYTEEGKATKNKNNSKEWERFLEKI